MWRKKYLLIRIVSVFVFLSGWQLVAWQGWLGLPTFFRTVQVFLRLVLSGDPYYGRTLQGMTLSSLKVVLEALLAGCVLGLPLGVVMGWWRTAEMMLDGILEMLRPIPPLAWIPIAYLLFAGLHHPTFYVQLFVVFIGVFFPVVLNTAVGIKTVNQLHVDVARTCGLNQPATIMRVVLPSALPSIITGIRVGLGVGWMCIIAAEFVGGKMGIGFYIWSAYNLGGRSAEIISGMTAIGLVGYALNQGILWLERRIMPWRWL